VIEKAVDDENEVMILFLMENGYVTDPNFKFTPGQFDLDVNYEEEIDDEDEDENDENNNEENEEMKDGGMGQ
jgi:hypothetical protein